MLDSESCPAIRAPKSRINVTRDNFESGSLDSIKYYTIIVVSMQHLLIAPKRGIGTCLTEYNPNTTHIMHTDPTCRPLFIFLSVSGYVVNFNPYFSVNFKASGLICVLYTMIVMHTHTFQRHCTKNKPKGLENLYLE